MSPSQHHSANSLAFRVYQCSRRYHVVLIQYIPPSKVPEVQFTHGSAIGYISLYPLHD